MPKLAKNQKKVKGARDPLVEARREVVADFYYSQGYSSRRILRAFETEAALKAFWIETDEGSRPPSLGTIQNDIRTVKQDMQNRTDMHVIERINTVDAELTRVKHKTYRSQDWSSWLRATDLQMKLLGLEAPKDMVLVNELVKGQMQQAIGRLHDYYGDDIELHNEIMEVIAGRISKQDDGKVITVEAKLSN